MGHWDVTDIAAGYATISFLSVISKRVSFPQAAHHAGFHLFLQIEGQYMFPVCCLFLCQPS